MQFKKNIVCFFVTFISVNALAYVVKKDDTLSSIALKHFSLPIYGPHGGIKKILKLNSKITNRHLIRPGQVFNLDVPEPSRAHASETVLVPAMPEEGPPLVLIPVESSEFTPTSTLRMLLGVEYFKMDAIDRSTKDNAVVISNASPRATFIWNLAFTEKWATEIGISHRSEQIAQDKDAVKKLDKTSFGRTNFYFGVTRTWSDFNKSQVYVGRSERGFIRALSATELTMDAGNSTDVGLKHENIFFNKKNASVGMELHGAYLGAAKTPSYSTEAGYAAHASAFMRHKFKSMQFEGKGMYGIWKQDTSTVTQDTKELGVSFGVGWEFK